MLRPARVVLGVLICGVLQGAACGKSPIQPPPPPPPPGQLQMICPLPLVLEAASPLGTNVSFDLPVPTGGRPPYSVECIPGSGSTFALGDKDVRCTAVDAATTQAACGFTVRVRVSQTLRVTKFVAFGDSITGGAVSLAPLIMMAGPDTYPYKLEQMLLQRYPTQTFVVSEQGVGGERTDQGARRLPGVLEQEKPEVLLLLEGVNAVWILSTSSQVANIRSMVSTAQQRDVDVIIATVMPVSAELDARRPGSLSRIRALNDRIFQIADDEGLGPVVDLYALFSANMHLIGSDGLHPTLEGQTRIAEAFRDEIVKRYDSRTTMTSRLDNTPESHARR